jgi:hypothetical protein
MSYLHCPIVLMLSFHFSNSERAHMLHWYLLVLHFMIIHLSVSKIHFNIFTIETALNYTFEV